MNLTKANQSIGNTGLLGLSSMGSSPALPSNVPGGGGGSGSGSSSMPQLTLPFVSDTMRNMPIATLPTSSGLASMNMASGFTPLDDDQMSQLAAKIKRAEA